MLGSRVRVFPPQGGRGKRRAGHYFRVLKKFPAGQLLEIFWDKYDSGYQLRGLMSSRRKPQDAPLVLLPTAYGNVSRTGMAYAAAVIFKQMADRIVLQIKELTESDSHRREFLANITHDLRTPLTSLQGYLETLLMKEGALTPEEQRNYLMIAIKRSGQLGKLVSELFELAKLDSPDVQVRFEPFSLDELIRDILQKFQLAAEKKKITLHMDVAENLSLAFADIGLCERVLDNLIENAVRYTPEDGAIRVTAVPKDERIEVQVSDTGSGIRPEDITHIFERSSRLKRERPKDVERTGLGLAIVKRILELHGSDIRVNSAVNVGTTFIFTLPVYKPQIIVLQDRT